jgi:hypothetical protein
MRCTWPSSGSIRSECLAREAKPVVRLIVREVWVPLPVAASLPAPAPSAPAPAVASPAAPAPVASSLSASVLDVVLAALHREEGVPLRWAITAVESIEHGARRARLEAVLLVEP